MNMNDYKNAVSRMRMRRELKDEIIEASLEKRKNRFSERAISIAVATTICLSAFTVVFGVARVFKDTNNLSSDIAVTSYVPGTSFSSAKSNSKDKDVTTVFKKKAALKRWDEYALSEVFPHTSSEYDDEEGNEFFDPLLETGEGFLHWNSDTDYDYQIIFENLRLKYSEDDLKSLSEIPIDGLSKNVCVEAADNCINELGLDSTMQRKQVYALSEATLIDTDYLRNDYGVRVDGNGNELPEWTVNQEAYLIIYEPSYGLPLAGNTSEECLCEVVIGRYGITYFHASSVLDLLNGEIETVDICSSDKAAETIHEYWSKYLSNDAPETTDINKNCRLVYYVEEFPKIYVDYSENLYFEYILKPYWEFRSEDFQKSLEELGFDYSGYVFNDTLIVDAVKCEFDEGINFELYK